MTPDWHLPVAAILDHFALAGITLMGFSLGGCLVIRAAAREPRVARAIANDILTDLYEVNLKSAGASGGSAAASGLAAIAAHLGHIPAPLVNAVVAAAAKEDLLMAWGVAQGERVTGAATAADLFQAYRQYRTDDVSPLVTQDVLLMAGTKDHYVPFPMLGQQLLTLTAAHSVTARVFTEAEHAQSHCQTGNTGLAIKVILDWLDATGGRTAEPSGSPESRQG